MTNIVRLIWKHNTLFQETNQTAYPAEFYECKRMQNSLQNKKTAHFLINYRKFGGKCTFPNKQPVLILSLQEDITSAVTDKENQTCFKWIL